MAGILCSGDLFFDRMDDNGNSLGLLDLGNATELAITESSSVKERLSRRNKTYGQVLDSAAIKGAAKASLTLDEMNVGNLALACLGESAAITQSAGPALTKNFDLTAVEEGVFYEIGHVRISVASVKIGTEAVAPAAYEINEEGGLIKFTDEAPAEGTVVVTYAAPAMAGYKVSGGASPDIKGRLLLIGINLVSRESVRVDILEAVLTPKSGIDFLSDNYASAKFEGTLNTPTGASAPYTVTVLAAAA